MPCSGPSIEEAYKQGEEIFNEFVKHLKEKYYIHPPSKDIPFQHLKNFYTEAEKDLKLAIQELVWANDAASW